ncbi:MAG: hypothetical protein RLZZ81_120 [Pseudomonadota bacterium]|jgi:hypothetical protein
MTNKTLEPDQILSMTLSGIFDEIKSQDETEQSSKNENTLSIDNNVNALSINIVVAFWWVVNYVIESVARNICNYLKEDLKNYEVSSEQQEHTKQQYKYALLDQECPEFNTFTEIGGAVPIAIEVH